ncbi:MAG: autoinducer 2 sensor kinase/phosphatase LuxQ [Ignavibacteria bacterium]|nr:MAG: autoinducer 2 sensor kinase/phosphatase LuxQ [Ignavibacteria bacterium]KAF0160164.1 MAG: autoinducer 2 sensor kinase/phosphatase LuxQ [Ignavibacteria bacterium]
MVYSNNRKILPAETEVDFQSYTELPNHNPLIIIDLDLKIVYCNESFKTTFNLDTGDDISGMNSNPEFVYLVKGFHESRYKNISIDITLSNDSDTQVNNYFVRIERVIIKLNQYFVLVIESLEQRNRLENKITSLHNALDQGKLPLMILDGNRKVSYVSKSFEIVLSKEIESIYNKDLLEIISDHLNSVESEELKLAVLNKRVWKKLICLQKKYPIEYWEFTLNPVFEIDRQSPNYILIASNLTEHINQKRVIERSEKKQRLIIDNISDLLLIVERVGASALFDNANDNFCKIFGLDKNKIYSFKIEDFIPEPLSDEIYNSITELNSKRVPYFEFNYRHFDERDYNCKITSVPEKEKSASYFIISMKDITEEVLYSQRLKKAYHKEMQLNKMKSDFLANISHEIRTPFNAVVGFSEIIDESIETQDWDMMRELMDSMKEVLGRALNLFTNIIEVSQIESGEVELEKVDLSCNRVVRNIYEKLGAEAQKNNIEFILNLTEENCTIEVDWVKYEKIVHSLVENAIKYTSEGYVYVGTQVYNGIAELTVSDTGVGMDSSQIERLLKPFTQEIEGYTRPFEGAGLGLTIAYKLTLLMGGKFDIVSEKNKGTKITVSFPLSV